MGYGPYGAYRCAAPDCDCNPVCATKLKIFCLETKMTSKLHPSRLSQVSYDFHANA